MTFVDREVPADVRAALVTAPHLADDSVITLLAAAAEHAKNAIQTADNTDDKITLLSASHLFAFARLMLRYHIEAVEQADPDAVLGVLFTADQLMASTNQHTAITEALRHLIGIPLTDGPTRKNIHTAAGATL